MHSHLEHQLAWLRDRDPPLSAVIADIQREEEGHLAWAIRGRDGSLNGLDRLVTLIVEGLIWLSTNGESARLSKALAPKAPSAPAA